MVDQIAIKSNCIAVTMGDPNGIGPEIVAKLAADPARHDAPMLIVGDAIILERAVRIAGVSLDVARISHPHELNGPRSIGLLQTGPSLDDDMILGQIDPRAGAAAYAYINRATDFALEGSVAAIVTAPINKAALNAASISFPGHTEILAARSGTNECGMMLANEELRVMLVSIHLSLADAIRAVTFDNELRAIRLAYSACRAFGITAPRIAVAGLNPHAAEDGLFGNEERQIIAPAIEKARAEGIDATGPFPGDTIFMRARNGDYDVVVAQYHDQGLIPIKLNGIDQGVNITVGLPFIRTSVDHGTAFDIAGMGRADHRSLAYAFRQAALMATARAGI